MRSSLGFERTRKPDEYYILEYDYVIKMIFGATLFLVQLVILERSLTDKLQKCKKFDRCRTRTCNLLIRSQVL